MDRFVRLVPLWITGLVFSFASVGWSNDSPHFDDASLEFFEKQVRPILIARCYECHADKGTPRGGLRLDSRDALIKGGDTGPAVTFEKPGESLFVSSINYGDTYQMPPKSKLPASEIAILTRWVEMGLPWPKETVKSGTVKPFDLAARTAEHWCWHPVKQTAPPAVKNQQWPISNVDRFILSKLESKGLSPAPAAERHTLLRRVYFDLIGLPPSPEEVEQFIRDERPNALEIVVDRLLDSVHFGERWGRHWLDLTRYAETRGHEFEPVIPNAWQYRDYVIRALNADVPFDRFLTEQVAGDLIGPRWRSDGNPTGKNPAKSIEGIVPGPINESLLGTGFWFLGEEVHSPVDIRKDETDRIDNRLDVLTKTFLGLTVACARCHDHKFDAISQQDYYALAGYAISSSYRQVRIETMEQHRQVALRLHELRNEARQKIELALREQTKPVLDRLEHYWLASDQALEQGVTIADVAGEMPPSPAAAEVIERLATEGKLDPRLLVRWCRDLISAKGDSQHPLHALYLPSSKVAAQDSTQANTENQKDASQSVVVDFGDPALNQPIQDGVSFGLSPVSRGTLQWSGPAERPVFSIARVGGWERDLFWKNIKLKPGTEVDNGTVGAWQLGGRMVRTPEFTLKTRHAWYLVRGSVRAYASVNSHLIVVGPLHGSVFREFKHTDDQWHWVSHDLSHYPGHRMHVEFSPADDGPCAVAMVVQSEQAPQPWDSSDDPIKSLFAAGQSREEQLKSAANKFRNAVNSTMNDRGAQVPSSSPNASATELRLADWFVSHPTLFLLEAFKPPESGLVAAEAELAKNVQWESTLAPAILDGNGVDEFLLIRGNSNTPKEPVSRRYLSAFEHNLTSPQVGSGRKQLAEAMLRSPVVPRVAVNRIWHHLFGRGIVPTVDNLGVLGLPPSHPELLDFLASEFVAQGWSTKSLIRSLILSRAYQMSSHPTDTDKADPDNELWHRMPIKRLEGEVIRDSLLAVSGRLDQTPFGPSVPIHLTEFMQGRGRPGSGPLDGNGRRSIYISVRRNFLSPMMLAFDTPNPFSTVGRRTISNVPAQALILMNDPFVVEQANLWAARLLADGTLTTDQRLDRLYQLAFARHPSAAEAREARSFLASVEADPSETERSAWNNLCHVMFNVKEFVFIE